MRRVTSSVSLSLNSAGAWRARVVDEDRDFRRVAGRARRWCRRRSRRPWRRRACSCARSRPSPSAALRAGWTCRSRWGRRRRSGPARSTSSVGSTNDLKPSSRSRLMCMRRSCVGCLRAQPNLARRRSCWVIADARPDLRSRAQRALAAPSDAATRPARIGSTISRISLIADHGLHELALRRRSWACR